MSTASCCCCCSSRSASSRCCVDYSRLTERHQRQSVSECRPPSSADPPSSPFDAPRSPVRRPCIVDVPPSPDDADEAAIDGVYDRRTSSAGRPTVLRLTTFKPSLQPPPRRETVATDGVPSTHKAQDGDTSAVEVNRPSTKHQTTSTRSNVVVVSTSSSAALDRLQPDLLPLVSSSAVADDTSTTNATTHGSDDLP